jgi:predicted DNA-binding transcriptional regulator AlpA
MDKLVYSVDEFCKAVGISRASFYNYRKLGLAPRTVRLHGKVLITRKTAEDWLRDREEVAA